MFTQLSPISLAEGSVEREYPPVMTSVQTVAGRGSVAAVHLRSGTPAVQLVETRRRPGPGRRGRRGCRSEEVRDHPQISQAWDEQAWADAVA